MQTTIRIAPASMLLDISRKNAGHRERREKSWLGYSEGDTWGAIPRAVSHLYRGQTGRHLPLLPSIARALDSSDVAELWKSSPSDQAKIVLRLAQSWWFAQELSRHPVSEHAKKHHLTLDEIALAQHYGIPTGYLDLTDDFDVSAFFATCCLRSSGWEPVDTGIGVIYRVNLETQPEQFAKYTPLGPQRLPRPFEQCAWVTELPMCHSFESWLGVDMLQFHHSRSVSEYFLAMFDGGKLLFPTDPLTDVADEIMACGELPTNLAEAALASFATDPYGIRPNQIESVRRGLAELVTLTAGRQLLHPEHISFLLARPEWCNEMLAPVTANWRAVRRIPVL